MPALLIDRHAAAVYIYADVRSDVRTRFLYGVTRPVPAFDFLDAYLGVQGSDLALELLSWCGVLLSAFLAFGHRVFGVWVSQLK